MRSLVELHEVFKQAVGDGNFCILAYHDSGGANLIISSSPLSEGQLQVIWAGLRLERKERENE